MATSASLQPERLGERYELQDQLGRGGMASVHRARDRVSGQIVALKQLTIAQDKAEYSALAGMFEREFHTLAQLRHPHVIEVYDYGRLADGSPFYTMELLDGGDLRECAPLPWREACRLLFDVCSSLALVHSRRLLHRDISSRNIHRTHDGHAKLIDFGAMTAMSPGGADVVGTPAFVAPETLHRLALDARTDLYSLGVTLYHALTASLPYAARTFPDVLVAWAHKVRAPSSIVPEIPAALDDLVLALIALDPALRPTSAFEVMQRMAAIAGLPLHESESVSRAYLATPALVGRESLLSELRERLLAARMRRGGALLIQGAPGAGRSRALDLCALEAKTLGFTVLRASASGTRARFGVVRDLTQHLLEALPGDAVVRAAPDLFDVPLTVNDNADSRPQLRDFASLDASQVQQSVLPCWRAASREQPLFFAIDDVERIDAASAAVLAACIDSARNGRTCVALSALDSETDNEALHVLARRCKVTHLQPLTAEQTHELLCSVFGDVANLAMLAREVQAIAGGNPRQSMELSQYLVDRGAIRYAAGNWCIPERLSSENLPASAAEAKRAQLDALSEQARFLAECHALAFFAELRDRDYRALLPDVPPQEIERALSELAIARILLGDGYIYRVSDRVWATALRGGIAADALALRHRALARMYQASAPTAFIYHAFEAGLDEEAHAALVKFNAEYLSSGTNNQALFELNVGKMMECYPRALASAERLGFSRREMNELWRWNMLGATTMQHGQYPPCARRWLAQLEHDCGLDLYRADSESSDKQQRLLRALTAAQQRYLDTPEAERVYGVEEAIRYLSHYVVVGIALGGRAHDYELLGSLPELLEPFISLSPLLDAVFNNALATCASSDGAMERARERWTAVWNQLQNLPDAMRAPYVTAMANAIAFAIGMTEAHLGLPSASEWADRLDEDPYQRVSALQLRRIVRLEKGDIAGAEQFRKQAEVLSLQSRAPQMFKALVAIELAASSQSGDLAGLQDALERTRALATHYPGWKANLLFGEASFQLARGDYERAKRYCEECIASTSFDSRGRSKNNMMWFSAHVALADALLGLGDDSAAHAVATRAQEAHAAKNLSNLPAELVRVLALAEAKLGETDRALARLSSCISEQTRLGVTGVHLGILYEACAQIAIMKHDSTAFEQFADSVGREYRRGSASALSSRYERLVNEAIRQGVRAQRVPDRSTHHSSAPDWTSIVNQSMAHTQKGFDRAQAALEIICSARRVNSGQLYLRGPSGLFLAAIRGSALVQPLAEAREYVADIEARSNEMDDMDTDAGVHEPPSTTVSVGNTTYVLLPLVCVHQGEQAFVGAVAVERGELESDPLRDSQMLSLVAGHLLGSHSMIASSSSNS